MRAIICAVFLAYLPKVMFSQSAVAPLTFEVISVKPTPPERQNQLRTDRCPNGGRFVVAGPPVMWSLLTIAKNGTKLRAGGGVRLNGSVQLGQSGKPDWPDGWTMSEVAGYLSNYIGRPIVDRTGLTGRYGISLDFWLSNKDDRPSIFTAVQEQLGLKLDAGKAPIEMLIIDHIQKPDAN